MKKYYSFLNQIIYSKCNFVNYFNFIILSFNYNESLFFIVFHLLIYKIILILILIINKLIMLIYLNIKINI